MTVWFHHSLSCEIGQCADKSELLNLEFTKNMTFQADGVLLQDVPVHA